MTDWRHQAACRNLLPPAVAWTIFFPNQGENAEPAKRICRTCPAQQPCLTWALDQGTGLAGVWGATSEHDRRKIHRDRQQDQDPQ